MQKTPLSGNSLVLKFYASPWAQRPGGCFVVSWAGGKTGSRWGEEQPWGADHGRTGLMGSRLGDTTAVGQGGSVRGGKGTDRWWLSWEVVRTAQSEGTKGQEKSLTLGVQRGPLRGVERAAEGRGFSRWSLASWGPTRWESGKGSAALFSGGPRHRGGEAGPSREERAWGTGFFQSNFQMALEGLLARHLRMEWLLTQTAG